MKIVLVDWLDSHMESEWTEISSIKKNARTKGRLGCQSVGYLIEQNDQYILLGMSLTVPFPKEEQSFTGTMQIPMPAITKITDIGTT